MNETVQNGDRMINPLRKRTKNECAVNSSCRHTEFASAKRRPATIKWVTQSDWKRPECVRHHAYPCIRFGDRSCSQRSPGPLALRWACGDNYPVLCRKPSALRLTTYLFENKSFSIRAGHDALRKVVSESGLHQTRARMLSDVVRRHWQN